MSSTGILLKVSFDSVYLCVVSYLNFSVHFVFPLLSDGAVNQKQPRNKRSKGSRRRLWYQHKSLFRLVLLLPGCLLILIAHDEILLPDGERRTQAGGRVVEGVCFFGNVDQRRLQHLLHIHNGCGLQTTIPHLPYSRPNHCKGIKNKIC